MDLSIFKCQKKILTSKLFTNHDSLNNLSGFYIFLRHGWTYFPGPILLCVQYEDFITMNTLSEFLKFPKSHYLLTNLWNAKKILFYEKNKRTTNHEMSVYLLLYIKSAIYGYTIYMISKIQMPKNILITIIPKYVDFAVYILYYSPHLYWYKMQSK